MKVDELIRMAKDYRDHAAAPYSKFLVGAALETREGKVFGGCNIENASYGLTVCAERVAIWKALSEGESDFRRLVVVADTENLTPPCGACRQVIWEFCGDIEIILSNLKERHARFRMNRLLPHPFDKRFMAPRRESRGAKR
jgi:cytidine deaminase